MPIDAQIRNTRRRRTRVCAPHGRSRRTTPSVGTEFVGVCRGKKCVPDFAELRWKSSDGWTVRTGCASGNAICACGTAQTRPLDSQVLPAYGLQDLRIKK